MGNRVIIGLKGEIIVSITKLNGKLKGNMAFEMNINGHNLVIDASEEIGGNNLGPRPKPLLLAGLIGCTGMDVMSILQRMRIELEDLDIEVSAENTEEHPKVYQNIHLIFKFKGKDLPVDKLKRAVELSQEKYCGVTAMLRASTSVTYEIVLVE